MKLEQFPQGDPLDGTEPPAVVIMKELLSFLRAKALNHPHRILRHALYVKQQMSVVIALNSSESASEECFGR